MSTGMYQVMITDSDGLPCVGLGGAVVSLVGVSVAIHGYIYNLTESTTRQGMYYTYGLPSSIPYLYDIYIKGVRSEILSGTSGKLISIA